MEMREPLDTSEKPMSSQRGTRTVLLSAEVANETTAPMMAVETRCIDTKVVAAHAAEMQVAQEDSLVVRCGWTSCTSNITTFFAQI